MSDGRYVTNRKREYLINHFKYNVDTHPEKYFYPLLVLFQPWKTTTNLKNGCETYAESFYTAAAGLEKAQEYHEILEEIRKGKSEAEELIKRQIDINNEEDLHNNGQSAEGNLNQIHVAMEEFRQIED